MSIINTFKTSDDLYKVYPKTKYFTLKDIFSDYWYDFLEFALGNDGKKKMDFMLELKKMNL